MFILQMKPSNGGTAVSKEPKLEEPFIQVNDLGKYRVLELIQHPDRITRLNILQSNIDSLEEAQAYLKKVLEWREMARKADTWRTV